MVKIKQIGASAAGSEKRKSRTLIPEIEFHNPRLRSVGIDVLTLQEIRQRAPETLIDPQRVAFYFLMFVQEGRSHHTIDFVDYQLAPGSVVFLRPGQVQQWHMHDEMQGLVVLLANEVMAPSIGPTDQAVKLLALDLWPAKAMVSMGLFLQAYSDALRLRNEILNFDDSERESTIIWYAALALLLRLAKELRVGEVSDSLKQEAYVYRLFTQELEQHFYKRLSVADYAQRLGYSQSTLSRACMATVQLSAKAVIDKRTVLEAKRLLAHNSNTSAAIAHQLGFLEPTNFVKFFRRLTGTTPINYRNNQLQNFNTKSRSAQ